MSAPFINVCFSVTYLLIPADTRGCKYFKGKKKDDDDDGIAEVSLHPPKRGKDLGFKTDTFLSSFCFPASLKFSGGI